MPTSAAGSSGPLQIGGQLAEAEHGFTPVRRSAEHGFTPVRRSAEHGFTPVRRSAEHGFTLVELMVVIVVIALASTAAMWAMPDPRGRVLDEATRFAARIKAARDAAIIGGRPVSLWVTPGGYGFDARYAGRWMPIPDKPLRVERWSEGTHALLPADKRVRLTFDTTGLADRALEVRLDRGGPGARVEIGGEGSVRVVPR